MSPEVLSRLLPMGARYENYADIPESSNWNDVWVKTTHFGPDEES